MAITRIKFDVNKKGIGELLVSKEVKADLAARARRVMDAAQSSYPDMPYRLDDATTNRARYRVVAAHPKAMRVEAKYRTLGKATDAAR